MYKLKDVVCSHYNNCMLFYFLMFTKAQHHKKLV